MPSNKYHTTAGLLANNGLSTGSNKYYITAGLPPITSILYTMAGDINSDSLVSGNVIDTFYERIDLISSITKNIVKESKCV